MDLPEIAEPRLSAKVDLIRSLITATEDRFLEEREVFRKLGEEDGRRPNLHRRLSQMTEQSNAMEEKAKICYDRMVSLAREKASINDEYEFLGGESGPEENDQDGVQEAVRDAGDLREELGQVRRELAETSTEMVDLTWLEKLDRKTQDYRKFVEVLNNLRSGQFFEIPAKLPVIRSKVENLVLKSLALEMQKVFESIVPEGSITLVAVHPDQVRGLTSTSPGSFYAAGRKRISLDLRVRFSEDEPFRGCDALSGEWGRNYGH